MPLPEVQLDIEIGNFFQCVSGACSL
jgi:hypothetical protein